MKGEYGWLQMSSSTPKGTLAPFPPNSWRPTNPSYPNGRDPPDAEQDPLYQIWVRDLQPNTGYTFRLRAFNGFGAGSWTHATFTTRWARPLRLGWAVRSSAA